MLSSIKRGAAVISSEPNRWRNPGSEILSPDLRQDDKPRLDKPLVVPAGAVVYRTAINVTNLKASGTQTVAVDGLTTAGLEASLAAVAGVFPEVWCFYCFRWFRNRLHRSSDATITAAYSGDLTIVDPVDSQAAVLVEVCYYLSRDAPTLTTCHCLIRLKPVQGY